MYDLKEIKAIPCGEVAAKYGMQLKQKHDRLWGKLRDGEKTASFSINLKTNLWYDFGSGKGGSVIDLVAELQGISPKEAINLLAEEYGFKKEASHGWRPLTDSQYRELGIQPERATMNFKFDLEKHTPEQLQRWSEKYGMHLKELASKFPDVYNRLVTSIALDNINAIRDVYYSRLNMFHDPATVDTFSKAFLKSASMDDAVVINRMVDLLQRAVLNKTADYQALKVDPEKDFKEKGEKAQEQKPLTEDEKVRQRIVNVYKKLFSFNQADYFTLEQALALKDINRVITNTENKFIPIEGIRQAYKLLGENVDKLQKQYDQHIKDGSSIPQDANNPEYQKWASLTDKFKADMMKAQEIFSKCSIVIDGIQEANLTMKNEISKSAAVDKIIQKSTELTL